MQRPLLLLVTLLAVTEAAFLAGVAKVDGTLPDASGVGVPLAGYNHGDRRYAYWPLPNTGLEYCNWMTPSTGIWNPSWIKAIVMQDSDGTMFASVTTETIGMSGMFADICWEIAKAGGLRVPRDNLIMSASHTHSGPGAIAPDLLWAVAPAMDLMVPQLQRKMANDVATALLQAQANMVPAKIAIGQGYLVGVTHNRRARFSPYVSEGTIDPHLGVIRVDYLNGTVMATVWDYAIHGTCFGPDNMKFSGDIMGYGCEYIEKTIGGVAMFINGDAGDVGPTSKSCQKGPSFEGGGVMGAAVVKERALLKPTEDVKIRVASQIIPFGLTSLNITLQRFDNCTSGGPLDICTICTILKCNVNLHLNQAWVENRPRFTAVSFEIEGNSTVIVSMPGEPLVELGWEVYNDTLKLGFDTTILAGYTNNHMGYFATPNEYDIGGYESQLTLWGRETAEMVRAGVHTVAQQIAPSRVRALRRQRERESV